MRLLRMLLVLAGTCGTVLAQTNIVRIRELSLEDCLQITLEHNLDVQIKRYNPEIAGYTLGAAYGPYDPIWNSSGSHDYNRSPGGVDAQGRPFSGTETDNNRFSTALQGLLPWGTTYSFGGNFSDTYGTRPGFAEDLTQPFFVTNSVFDVNTGQTISFRSTNFVSVPIRTPFENAAGNIGIFQLRQPLLRNFWIDNNRLQILLDKKNLKISELDLRNQVMTTVTAVEQAYYDLVFALENVKVQQKALELAERQLAEDKKKVEVGSLAPLDEKKSDYQAAASRADLLDALGTADTKQRVLKNLLSDDYSQWETTSVQPMETLVAVPEQFNLQESWRKGLTQRPDLLQQKLALEKQLDIIHYQKNQLLPALDIVGDAGYNGSGPNVTTALDQFRGRDNPFWSIGGQLSIPLSNRSARNNYRAAKASKEQIELQLKQLEQNVLIQIENAIAVAQTSFQRVQATREARIYAEAALDAEQKKLQSGKSTNFEVLRTQRDLTSARSAEIRALADYNIALAQIALDEGSTLERRHVTLELR